MDDRTDTHPGRLEEHYCETPGCDLWGGMGYSSSRSQPARWWCWEHYPYKTPGKPTAYGSLPG